MDDPKTKYLSRYLDAVGAVVADEDFLLVIHDDAIRELEMFGAAKLIEDVSHLIEDDHPHHLDNNNNNKYLYKHNIYFYICIAAISPINLDIIH